MTQTKLRLRRTIESRHFLSTIDRKGSGLFLVLYISRSEHAFVIICSLIYLLMCDGFFDGQSLGKRIVGLKTVYLNPHTKEYRNLHLCSVSN
ncbi:MAG: hypothetical protein R2877_01675 [Bdellovibrionota bacterium]